MKKFFFLLTLLFSHSILASETIVPFPKEKVKPVRAGRFSPGYQATLMDLEQSKCNLILSGHPKQNTETLSEHSASQLAKEKGIVLLVAVVSAYQFKQIVDSGTRTLGDDVEVYPLYESIYRASTVNVLLAENAQGHLEKGLGFVFPVEILDQRGVTFKHLLMDQPKPRRSFILKYQNTGTMGALFEKAVNQNIPKRLSFQFSEGLSLDQSILFWLPKSLIASGKVKASDLEAFNGFDMQKMPAVHFDENHPSWSFVRSTIQ